jgi:hypothetical protein
MHHIGVGCEACRDRTEPGEQRYQQAPAEVHFIVSSTKKGKQRKQNNEQAYLMPKA